VVERARSQHIYDLLVILNKFPNRNWRQVLQKKNGHKTFRNGRGTLHIRSSDYDPHLSSDLHIRPNHLPPTVQSYITCQSTANDFIVTATISWIEGSYTLLAPKSMIKVKRAPCCASSEESSRTTVCFDNFGSRLQERGTFYNCFCRI
jgi:hypothetical protein